LRHADDNKDVRLPHVSRHVLSHGEMRQTAKGVKLVTYACPGMVDANLEACAQAEHCQIVHQADGGRLSQSWCSFSKLIMHGTSVENALSILSHGYIKPSPGKAGHGIYLWL
jgi:hypothetical protein